MELTSLQKPFACQICGHPWPTMRDCGTKNITCSKCKSVWTLTKTGDGY